MSGSAVARRRRAGPGRRCCRWATCCRRRRPLHVSNFTLNLFGKFLTYAILALGLDLLWGYAGVLSLGHGVFFGLGAYAMGMHLMLEIGAQSVYQNALPDFMVWNQVKSCRCSGGRSTARPFTMIAIVAVPALVALVFGFLAFRSRIRGVYFSIITQALGAVGVAGLQPQRDEPRRHQRPRRLQDDLRLSR